MKLLGKIIVSNTVSCGLAYKPMLPFAHGVASYEKDIDEALWSRDPRMAAVGVWARQHPSAAYWFCRFCALADQVLNVLIALVPRPEWHVNEWRRIYGITWLRLFAGVMLLASTESGESGEYLTAEQLRELASPSMWCAICGHADHGSWTCGELIPVAGVGMAPCACSMSSPTPEKPQL